jgi:hypothetical protein
MRSMSNRLMNLVNDPFWIGRMSTFGRIDRVYQWFILMQYAVTRALSTAGACYLTGTFTKMHHH